MKGTGIPKILLVTTSDYSFTFYSFMKVKVSFFKFDEILVKCNSYCSPGAYLFVVELMSLLSFHVFDD